MSAVPAPPPESVSLEAAVAASTGRIAPTWPLDRAIAVSPWWERIDQPIETAAARLAVLGGMRSAPSRAYFREAWSRGRIGADDLAVARQEAGESLTEHECLAGLDREPLTARLPLLCDWLDADDRDAARLPWRDAITHQVSQACAAWFDHDLADWRPAGEGGLYAHWRESLAHDHGIGVLTGVQSIRRAASALPGDARGLLERASRRLPLSPRQWSDYFEALLLSVNGWASWCAYLRWQARLAGGDDGHLEELLAVRLAWEHLLAETRAADGAAVDGWSRAWSSSEERIGAAVAAGRTDWTWQRALEHGFQAELARALASPATGGAPASPRVQAAFCIDVRSEVVRRALESVDEGIQTIGFAGFFGLPIAYTPLGTEARRPQLPGLLAPAMEVTEAAASPAETNALAASRRARLADAARWGATARWPSAAFHFVEAAGVGYAAKLWRWVTPGRKARGGPEGAGLDDRQRGSLHLHLQGLNAAGRVELAESVLRAMSLVEDFAPVVLLVGHGSQSVNNPHAAGLDCGACCGQTGEVNARTLAGLLNDPDVRAGLADKGITIGAATRFVAALHNTTTDEIALFDPVPDPEGSRLQDALRRAGDLARVERADDLGLGRLRGNPAALLEALQRRGNDGAQTRPEWGLANNAAFVIAPRTRTRHLDLKGRVFLHDYEAGKDTDGSVLELLMTAPMLVTHWINAQYNASTVDPEHFGSGNKVLHNVVGGVIGVFEGNGGDLRVGLPRQSVHDGRRWMHEPLRLSVYIEAPGDRIEAVIARHEVVRNLLHNGWLHLFCLEDEAVSRYTPGGWKPIPA
ncbi:MAG: DUF2309 domain-containing protein [Gammaproteobacteria bacterium]